MLETLTQLKTQSATTTMKWLSFRTGVYSLCHKDYRNSISTESAILIDNRHFWWIWPRVALRYLYRATGPCFHTFILYYLHHIYSFRPNLSVGAKFHIVLFFLTWLVFLHQVNFLFCLYIFQSSTIKFDNIWLQRKQNFHNSGSLLWHNRCSTNYQCIVECLIITYFAGEYRRST